MGLETITFRDESGPVRITFEDSEDDTFQYEITIECRDNVTEPWSEISTHKTNEIQARSTDGDGMTHTHIIE